MHVEERHIPARTVAVVRGIGREADVEAVRRPMYQHMVLHELVGGPSILRFHPDHSLDAMVVSHGGFDGDDMCEVELLPAGRYAVAEYEGPAAGVPKARRDFLAAVRRVGLHPRGPMLQVHLMDEIDGVTEQQFQVLVG